MDIWSLGFGAIAFGQAAPYFRPAAADPYPRHNTDADLANCTVRNGPNGTEVPYDRLYNERCRKRLLGQTTAGPPLDIRPAAARARPKRTKASTTPTRTGAPRSSP